LGRQGKTTVPESEDEKDLKRKCVVLSKDCEVVGPGYSRLSGDVARVADRGGESGNPNRVDRVHREYDTDQWQIGLLGTVGVTGVDT
jgi:hypothetical protein